MTEKSPRIAELSWGVVVLADGRRFKDVKLFPGGAREWDWSETGTRHRPGIQPQDVQELIDHGATRVILSRGVWGRLAVPAGTVDYLKAAGITVDVFKSREAVRRYNELSAAGRVGALVHSTC